VIAFLSRRLRRWVLLTIVVPLVGIFAHKAAERIERRAGRSTTASKGLRQVGKFAGRREKHQDQNPSISPAPGRTS
jgi:hypothetical protein